MYNILTIQGGINVKEISSDQKIGSNIALIRKAKKMTQKDLARKIGISQPAWGIMNVASGLYLLRFFTVYLKY